MKIDNENGKRSSVAKIKMQALANFEGIKEDVNHFEFEGYIREKFAIRDVSRGRHKIIDFKMVSKYRNNKNIFSCNAWDSVVDDVIAIPDGGFIEGVGRLQKRDFIKINKETGLGEENTIYEISVNKIVMKQE